MAYHRAGVCEKGRNIDFANALSKQSLENAIKQLDKCIYERQIVMNKYPNNGDAPHKRQMKILLQLQKNLINIQRDCNDNTKVNITYTRKKKFKTFRVKKLNKNTKTRRKLKK